MKSLPYWLRFLSLTVTAVFLSSLLVVGAAQALILQSAEELVFDEYVTEDVYLAGGDVTIQQDIDGDLFVAGGNVTVNSHINGDLFIGGGNVAIRGGVSDDVRLVAGSLSVNGEVGGDMIVIGGDLDLDPDASVLGDVVLLAGNADLYGTVNKSVLGILGRLTIGGTINGNVNVRATEKVVLLNNGHVAGDVTYFAPQKLEDHGGQIDGATSFNEIVSSSDRIKEGLRSLVNRGQFIGALWSYLSLLLIGGLLVAFLPNFFHRTSEKIRTEGLRALGIGFLTFILIGMGSVIAIFTLIGVQLAFMCMAFLFILGELGRVAAGYWLGSLIVRESGKRSASKKPFWRNLGTLATGLLIMKLVAMIPILGWIASFVFFLIGAGAIVMVQKMNYHHLVKERMV